MEQHWKLKDLGLTIVFSVIYFAVVLAATIMGGIHPLLYLFVTALIALVAWIPYMYVMAKVPKAGGTGGSPGPGKQAACQPHGER